MKTIRLGTSPTDLTTAAELIQKGELVAFPTETVYGLGADVFRDTSVQQVFTVKGRPSDNPLIVHISDREQAHLLTEDPSTNISDYTSVFYLLTQAFWPGPLTIIVPKRASVPDSATGNLPKVAIRMPNHPVALDLITRTGTPLVGPSANLSGKPSPTCAEDVLDDLDGLIAAVIDAGQCSVGIESTVIDITTSPIILRPGIITQQDIESVLRMPIAHAISVREAETAASPGMKYTHYSPATPIHIIQKMDITPALLENPQVLLLINDPPLGVDGAHIKPLDTQTLYRSFRWADKQKLAGIYIVLDEHVKKQTGLMNRIMKAAGI
jgi:L-threonylcarbamoyladenylate synthase